MGDLRFEISIHEPPIHFHTADTAITASSNADYLRVKKRSLFF